jgi:NADH-quinone oxidoreductase subunit I
MSQSSKAAVSLSVTPALGPRQVQGIPLKRPERTPAVQSYIPEMLKGLALGSRPDPVLESINDGINTISYPEQKRPYPERFRGVHRLTQRDDGSPRCVACLCCSTACPAQCIHIEAGDYQGDQKHSGYEKFPKRFVIDELRCIFCGFCVEACPCDAIRMDTGMHPAPYDSRDQFIYEKDLLLAMPGRDGDHDSKNPRVEPGESGFAGVTRMQHH